MILDIAQEKWSCGGLGHAWPMAYGYWSYRSVGLSIVCHPLMTSSRVPHGTTRIRTLFLMADVIGMLMVGVAPSYVIGMCYSDHYSDPYVIGIWYGGSTVYPVPSWY